MWGLQQRGHGTRAVFAVPSLRYQQDHRPHRQTPAAAYRLTNTSRLVGQVVTGASVHDSDHESLQNFKRLRVPL